MDIRANELAELLGVHVNTTNRWCREGIIKAHKEPTGSKGRPCWVIKQADLNRFLTSSRKYCRIYVAISQAMETLADRHRFLEAIDNIFHREGC